MTTVNHERWRRQHIGGLATDAAPSRPLGLRPRRRRIDWLGILAGIVGLLVIAGTLVFIVVALTNTTI